MWLKALSRGLEFKRSTCPCGFRSTLSHHVPNHFLFRYIHV